MGSSKISKIAFERYEALYEQEKLVRLYEAEARLIVYQAIVDECSTMPNAKSHTATSQDSHGMAGAVTGNQLENDEPLREMMYDYRNAHPIHAENYFQRVVRWIKQKAVLREWSDWQQPVMDGYRMECCDCGLTHEVQFRVYRVDERPASDETYGPEMPVTDYRIQMRMRRA